MTLVAPSLLAADFLHLERECRMLDESEADYFHLDVMDGRFVPNISFGMSVIGQIRKTTNKFFDVHLMILEPEKYAEELREAGANSLTVHYEACPHLHRNLQQIHALGMKTGVAVNPHTPVSLLRDVLADIDMVLIMSVNPGFGGQTFIEHSIDKIREVRAMIDTLGVPAKIEVDGGVDLGNAGKIIAAGADVLVAGSAVFQSEDPMKTIRQLKNG